jgi:hypothetical protein
MYRRKKFGCGSKVRLEISGPWLWSFIWCRTYVLVHNWCFVQKNFIIAKRVGDLAKQLKKALLSGEKLSLQKIQMLVQIVSKIG